MISESQVEKALHYLAESDEDAAKAKARVKGLEQKAKTIIAVAFLEAEGAQGERQQKAFISDAYKAHTEEYENAVYDNELYANKRKRAELTIDVWRSINANRRQG